MESSVSYVLLAYTNCSTGTGWTGTVILVLYLLEELEATKHISPGHALVVLREGRARLVENKVSSVPLVLYSQFFSQSLIDT